MALLGDRDEKEVATLPEAEFVRAVIAAAQSR
jgi:hypothetical protein